MQAAVSEWPDGGQTSVPWWLSRSVIDSVGLAGAEFARFAESGADLLSAGLGGDASADCRDLCAGARLPGLA